MSEVLETGRGSPLTETGNVLTNESIFVGLLGQFSFGHLERRGSPENETPLPYSVRGLGRRPQPERLMPHNQQGGEPGLTPISWLPWRRSGTTPIRQRSLELGG